MNTVPTTTSSCALTVHLAFHHIHRDVGAAYIWQLEGRGRLSESEHRRIGRTIEKAATLISSLEKVAQRGDFPSMETSHRACADILTGSRNVLRLSCLGYKKETQDTWQALKRVTIDRPGFWQEICAFADEIDAYMGVLR